VALLNELTRSKIMLKQFGGEDYTPTASWKLAAVTSAPDEEDGSGLEEPLASSYGRVTVPNDLTTFELSLEGTEVVNSEQWVFGPATDESWGPILGIALFDASDEYMGYAPFSSPRIVNKNDRLLIKPKSFIVAMETTPLSVYVEEAPVPTIKTSPDNTRFILSVDDAGATVWTETTAFGPPTSPTSLTDTAGVLSWTASSGDGGTPINSYTVWHYDSDSLLQNYEVLSSSELSYEIPLDEVGTFFVTAENIVGASDPSNEVIVS